MRWPLGDGREAEGGRGSTSSASTRSSSSSATRSLKIEKTYRDFSAHPGAMKKSAPQFAKAEATLHTLQTRLRLMDPPPDARRLRTLLVGLIGAQVGDSPTS